MQGEEDSNKNSFGTMLYSFQVLFLYVISSFFTIKLSKMIRGSIIISFTYR